MGWRASDGSQPAAIFSGECADLQLLLLFIAFLLFNFPLL